MLCKLLFIIHVKTKGLFKSYTRVQKQSSLAAKVGMVHAQGDCINVKFQVSVQINEVLLYVRTIKSKQTRKIKI